MWVVRCTGYAEVGGLTVYTIVTMVSETDKTFEVQHRFSDFLDLHAALQPMLPAIPPTFPVAKAMFGGNSVKKERVVKLQEYLCTAVKEGLESSAPAAAGMLRKFLGVILVTDNQPALPSSLGDVEPLAPTVQSESIGEFGGAAAGSAAAFGVPTDEELAAGSLALPAAPPAPAPAPASKPRAAPVSRPAVGKMPMNAPTSTASSGESTPFFSSTFATSRPSDVNEALREAIKSGATSECLELIKSKADPNFRDRQGNYPLHMACMFSRTEVVGSLLRANADMTTKNAAGELPTRLASVSLRMKMESYRDTGTFG